MPPRLSSTTNTSIVDQVTSTISNAASYVSESVQGAVSGASHEGNKEVAKDSNASLSDRASAGFSAVSDKIDQKSHDAKAEAHKETAKN
ncbi:BZ3500_MvSof-1268-A1-R1_Chr4-3g07291 [Microbotryum saponariae]|uniref:BZ3500_MvSof-1268-A1-R1_Chr4-3g07291 protein n=1 Tax=Microbotryum saponariae TaxID=289078 RepID=A0A2X0LIT0_9BASI|nr:BZ3500_MvSof-1268-A1-R1_Chr4-3g07291 [Microbotryum saponariae]SDA06954.1 BZ3501_MvSof-1269-A2-R1_Chr4-2g07000 [Microbotryum saponariae]